MPDITTPDLTPNLHLQISGALPGEALAIAIIGLQIKIFEAASPDMRQKIANDIVESQHRLHVIWQRLLDAMHIPKGE